MTDQFDLRPWRFPGVAGICRVLAAVVLTIGFASAAPAQEEITTVRELALQGTVESLNGDQLVVTDADGKARLLKIQREAGQPIMLSGEQIPLNAPAQIRVRGLLSPAALLEGMVVEAECRLTASGQIEQVSRLELKPPGSDPAGIRFADNPPAAGQTAAARVGGRIVALNRNRINIDIPRHPSINKNRLTLSTADIEQVAVDFDLTGLVRPGDIVHSVAAAEVSTGDLVVRRLDVELVGVRDEAGLTVDQQLQLKYAHLPDQPLSPREESSRHFVLRTDLSERRTAILLDKLETMVGLVQEYYGDRQRRLRQPIRCIVVSDLTRWDTREFLNSPVIARLPDFDPQGLVDRSVAKIQAGEGMTVYGRIGRDQTAIVYSADNDGVVQHEAVHGYCFLVFGNTGPLWYAEGMAEVGRYWEPDNIAVNANPAIIGYLRESEPLSMATIINARTIDGELWKAYAWRWVLCHMLAHNPNYSRAFHKLGKQLMTDQPASFESAFGNVADEVSFEYLHFLEHLQTGLRADLCAWDWQKTARPLLPGRTVATRVLANRGWQASGLRVEAGVTYRFLAEGQWQLNPVGNPDGADGEGSNGLGRLVGVIMKDFRLSGEFELGADCTWTAPSDGVLYLRCREPLASIADNTGEMEVRITRPGDRDRPLP